MALASELRYLVAGLRADLDTIDWRPSPRAVIGAEAAESAVRY
jgi:hypothetical protein